jgi:hypothetical protein
VLQDVEVGAAGIFQGVGQDGQAIEGPLIVGGPGQRAHVRRPPRRGKGKLRAEGIAEDVLEQPHGVLLWAAPSHGDLGGTPGQVVRDDAAQTPAAARALRICLLYTNRSANSSAVSTARRPRSVFRFSGMPRQMAQASRRSLRTRGVPGHRCSSMARASEHVRHSASVIG